MQVIIQKKKSELTPCSDIEHNRLDRQAAVITLMLGGRPLLRPLQSTDITKAVGVGCGTGIATRQLAEQFPYATVYVLNLSSVPDAARKLAPANVC